MMNLLAGVAFFFLVLLLSVAFALWFGFILMILWGALVSEVTSLNWPTLSYLQSVIIVLLIALIGKLLGLGGKSNE